MDDRTRAFLALAFDHAPASDANREIDRVRRERGVESYEIVLNAEDAFTATIERIVPRLIYHLETKKRRLPGYSGVALSVFSGTELYFLSAADAVEFLAKELQTSVAGLVDRFGPDAPPRSLLLK